MPLFIVGVILFSLFYCAQTKVLGNGTNWDDPTEHVDLKLIFDEENIENEFSNVADGLDCNDTFLSDIGNHPKIHKRSAVNRANAFKLKIKIIFPGTKWCGDGSIATSQNDLGVFAAADRCCREHDHCAESIEAGGSKNGLVNPGLFTRSHCDCDTTFYKCLKGVNDFAANCIGQTYFNILGPQCFRKDYPIEACIVQIKVSVHPLFVGKRCISYLQNRTGEKIYQWFDNHIF